MSMEVGRSDHRHFATGTSLLERPRDRPAPVVEPGHRLGAGRPIDSRRYRLQRLRSEAGLSFLLPVAAYLVVGILLDFVYEARLGDEVSRLANAYYVLHSADPHLAAIGFVWNPLPSIAEMPLLLFTSVWGSLVHHTFAASIASAAEMAGAVYQLNATLREWHVARTPRLILTAIFALDPMIVYYGGNGMSEALYLFTMLLTTRYLMRWLRTGSLLALVYAASGLGLAYLARNEAAGSAVLAGVVVFGTTWFSEPRFTRVRVMSALTDVTIFLAPFVVSFVGWAVTSYIITGAFFDQFSSVYGTSSQLKVSPNTVHTLAGRLHQEIQCVEAMAPLVPVVLVVALVLAWRRRDLRVLGPLAVLGGGLGFDIVTYLDNSLAFFFRYFILAAPLGILLVGSLLAPPPDTLHARLQLPSRRRRRPAEASNGSTSWLTRLPLRGTVFAALVALVLAGAAIPTTAAAMSNPNIGALELQGLGFILYPNDPAYSGYKQHFQHIEDIDDYLASLHLPDRDLLMDDFPSCAPDIIVESDQPRLFVIPNDRAFQRTLAAPLTFHAHYMLVFQPVGLNTLDALDRAYPALYNNGGGIAELVHTFPSGGACGAMRLYKVIATPQTTS